MTDHCVHHWLVDGPVMGEQKAVCKLCGAHTVFKPVFTMPWTNDASTIEERLSASVGPDSAGRPSV